jgi:uncharacterized membrane protein YozB (DUF420 family)
MTLVAAAAGPHPLATANAVLNSVAAFLLVAGWVCILRGHWQAHRAAMVAAFATSAVFLVSYLTYHWLEGSRKYAGPESLRGVYYVILSTHVPLAAAVPVLALRMFFLAWKGRWDAHKRLGRITMPIWLYVSVTGVVIYWMLYQLPASPAVPGEAATGRLSQTPIIHADGIIVDQGKSARATPPTNGTSRRSSIPA